METISHLQAINNSWIVAIQLAIEQKGNAHNANHRIRHTHKCVAINAWASIEFMNVEC